MRLRFIDNLGSRDAERFGVDFSKCTKGATGTFDEKTTDALLKFGIAVEDKGEGKGDATAEPAEQGAHKRKG